MSDRKYIKREGGNLKPVNDGENLDMLSGGVITSFTEFDTTLSAPAYKEGLQYYDSISKAISHYTEIAGVAPFRIGRALRSRAVSDDITPIVKGDILRISGGTSGTSPLVVKSQANVLKYVQETIGMAMNDAIQGGVVYIAVFDTIIGVNTLGTQVNDLVYLDPNNAGKFTFIQPKAPDYSLAFGFVTKVGETDGVISVRFGGYTGSDTSVNLEGFLNGIVTNTPQVDISVSGGIIYADVTNEEEPTKDLPFLIGDKRYLLNTTTNTGLGGAARVVVPAGADAQTLQESVIYAYLDNGVPTLGINSINPSLPYAKICDLSVFNATRTLADGRPFKYRRSNNTIDLKDGVIDGSRGLMVEALDNLRQKLGTNWVSGQDATPTVDNTQIRVALSGGVGRQFREANLPAFDGLLYTIFNDETNTITYEDTTNLTAITQTAGGTLDDLLQNNRYYIIRLFYMLNSNGVGNTVLATRPTGYYTADGDAFRNDTSGYAVTVNDVSVNEIVYPLYDLFIGRTGAGGTTITLLDIVDKKTRIPFGGTGGGSAGAGVTTFDGLSDTPADKLGQALKLLQVNAGETAIEFVDGSTKFVDLSTTQTIAGDKTFSNTILGSISGNAGTATALETARNIAGQSFDGTADISIASTDLSDTSNIARKNTDNAFTADQTFNGNVFVNGDKIAVDSRTSTTDNTIATNFGEVGAGVTSDISGIETDRGSADPYINAFFEDSDSYRGGIYYVTVTYTGKTGTFNLNDEIKGASSGASGYVVSDSGTSLKLKVVTGSFVDTETIDNQTVTGSATVSGSSVITDQTQAFATREDTPLDDGLAEWDSATSKFLTITKASLPISTATQNALDAKVDDTDIGVTVQPYNANTVIDASYVHTDNNYTNTDKAKVDFISVTQAVDLDTMESDIATNNAKVSNVTTNLGYTSSATNGIVTSSDGTDATIPLSSGVGASNIAGLMSPTEKDKLSGIEAGAEVNTVTDNSVTTFVNKTINGSGNNIYNLSASNISTGILNNARLSSDVGLMYKDLTSLGLSNSSFGLGTTESDLINSLTLIVNAMSFGDSLTLFMNDITSSRLCDQLEAYFSSKGFTESVSNNSIMYIAFTYGTNQYPTKFQLVGNNNGNIYTWTLDNGLNSLVRNNAIIQKAKYFDVALSSDQNITAGVQTKLQFSNEIADTDGWFDNVTNYRFQPNVNGLFQINMTVFNRTVITGRSYMSIFKNGTLYHSSTIDTNNIDCNGTLSLAVPLNGTTDYLEFYVYAFGSTDIVISGSSTNSSTSTRLTGHLVGAI